MHPGGPFSGFLASVQRSQNASLSRAEKCGRGSLAIVEIARQVRRLFGPMGGSGGEDAAYVAEDAEAKTCSSEDEVSDVWLAYRKAQTVEKRGKGASEGENICGIEGGDGEIKRH